MRKAAAAVLFAAVLLVLLALFQTLEGPCEAVTRAECDRLGFPVSTSPGLTEDDLKVLTLPPRVRDTYVGTFPAASAPIAVTLQPASVPR